MSVNRLDNKRELLDDLPFFKALSEKDRSTFLKSATLKSYPKHTSLYFQGDKADKFSILIDGWVKVYSVTVDGQEIISTILKKGDVLGEDALFSNHVCVFSATAIDSNVVLVEISSEILQQMIIANPAMAAHVMRSMNDKIKNLRIENGNLANMDTLKRLSCLLLRLSSWATGKGGSFPLPYDKSIMAAQLGMEPATFSRALTKLEEKGVTYKGSEIHIQDFSSLSEHCCLHCPVPKEQCAGRRLSKIKD